MGSRQRRSDGRKAAINVRVTLIAGGVGCCGQGKEDRDGGLWGKWIWVGLTSMCIYLYWRERCCVWERTEGVGGRLGDFDSRMARSSMNTDPLFPPRRIEKKKDLNL